MKKPGLVRVLVVDDSVTARLALRAALESDPAVCVVGEAEDGPSALRQVKALSPDIVLMDVYLRGHNGLDVAAEVMATCAVPILAVTAANPSDPALVFRGMDVGVLEICVKPPAPDDPSYPEARRQLTRLVKVLAHVPVVHRAVKRRETVTPVPQRAPVNKVPGVVLLGASTGGPPVLRAILEQLSRPFSLPIVLVQHMTAGFGQGFATWLQDATKHQVRVVNRSESLEAGVVYLAHDARHLRFTSAQTLTPGDEPPVRHQRPSIDVTFASAAEHFPGAVAAAVLTGMGNDGAEGLRALQLAGANTYVQSAETCVVDSMPNEALKLSTSARVVSPGELAIALQQFASTVPR